MPSRRGLLVLISLLAGLSGCSTSFKRKDASPPLAIPPVNQPTAAVSKPTSLAKNSSIKTPNQSAGPKFVGRYHPTWFGLRPNPLNLPPLPAEQPTQPLVGPIRPAPISTGVAGILPNVPEDPDPLMVKGQTQPGILPQTPSGFDPMPAPAASLLASSGRTEVRQAMKPVDEEVNPLPPAIERKPDVPPVDPEVSPTVAIAPRDPTTDSKPEPTAPVALSDPKAKNLDLETIPSQSPAESVEPPKKNPVVASSSRIESYALAVLLVGFGFSLRYFPRMTRTSHEPKEPKRSRSDIRDSRRVRGKTRVMRKKKGIMKSSGVVRKRAGLTP